MSNIRFSQLPTTQSLKDTDIVAVSAPDTSTPPVYTSVQATIAQVASKTVEDTTFTTSLKTTNKTVAGSINETLSNFANEYDTTASYSIGDCVLYAGGIYQCNTDISGGEAWTPAHWTQVKAVDVGSGGSSGDHITLTQDEYDALVQAGTVDPDAYYFISDAVFPSYAHEYSTNEQIVGTWIDGSPVYEKTLIFNNKLVTNDNSTCELVHGISNLGTVSFIVGAYYDFTSGGTAWATGTNAVFNYRVVWKIGSTSIHMTDVDQLSFSASPDRYYMFVIRYTKSSS